MLRLRHFRRLVETLDILPRLVTRFLLDFLAALVLPLCGLFLIKCLQSYTKRCKLGLPPPSAAADAAAGPINAALSSCD